MHPKMSQVVGGKKYNTETASVIASNEYWDGHNWERHGRNKHLYRTPKGNYFVAYTTQWQGERDYIKIEPIALDDAKLLYEELPEHEMEYAEAFGEEPEEA